MGLGGTPGASIEGMGRGATRFSPEVRNNQRAGQSIWNLPHRGGVSGEGAAGSHTVLILYLLFTSHTCPLPTHRPLLSPLKQPVSGPFPMSERKNNAEIAGSVHLSSCGCRQSCP